MNTISYFEIQSSDPQREVKFYSSVFGWKFIRENGLPIEYYRIETNGMHGGLLQRPAPVPTVGSGTNAYVNSVEVESFDNTAALILTNGGTVALPKFAVPGKCWQGYFLDADHNTFGIFEVDPEAK
jgi:predicted enzyme related to lactoylglutathione lyase